MENRYVCPVCGGPQVGVVPCPCFVNHLRERVVQPEDLHVKVGNLEIRRRPREGTQHVVFGSEVEFFLDGKPFAVRSLDLHFDMKSPVTAKIEIFVKDVKDMAQAVINGQSINGQSFEITSATIDDEPEPQRCRKCGWPPSAYGCTTEQCKRK